MEIKFSANCAVFLNLSKVLAIVPFPKAKSGSERSA